MKKLNACVMAAFAALSLHAAEISQVIVRQQWPWSTDVKVEYKIVNVDRPVNLTVRAYNGDVELDSTALADAMRGDLFGIAEDGVGSFVIDPVKAFGTAKLALANFSVKLSTVDAQEGINEILYRIVDLNNGSIVDVTRADFYGNKYGTYETSYTAAGGTNTKLSEVFIWTGVTNDPAYVTSKLVLRRIPAKAFGPWMMGDSGVHTYVASAYSGMSKHLVQLTEDYFVSVFPVTQAQYEKVTGSRGFGDYTDKAAYPLNDAYPALAEWWDIRGVESWPDSHAVDTAKFFGLLRAKTGGKVLFDFPTEAQWELACRAGWDVNECYLGYSSLGYSALVNQGWCKVSDNDRGNDGTMHPVGKLRPTAFGLYDMLGNCREWCLDLMNKNSNDYTWKSTTDPEMNPVGAAKADGYAISGHYYHAIRSSMCTQNYDQNNICVRVHRTSRGFNGDKYYFGFRVGCGAD